MMAGAWDSPKDVYVVISANGRAASTSDLTLDKEQQNRGRGEEPWNE